MRIREIIKEKGVTTEELANQLGISQSALNQSISGNPSVKVLTKISTALQVPLWQFFASPEEVQGTRTLATGNQSAICPHCGSSIEFEINIKSNHIIE